MGLTGLAGNGGFPTPTVSKLTNGSITESLTAAGHFVGAAGAGTTGPGAPTNLATCFSSANVSGGSLTDDHFVIQLTGNGGSTVTVGRMVHIPFGTTYGSIPELYVSCYGTLEVTIAPYFQNVATTGFDLFSNLSVTIANLTVIKFSISVRATS